MSLLKKIPFFLIFSYMLLACNSEGLDSNLPLLTDSTKNEILNLLNPNLHSSSALLEEFGTLFVAPGFHKGSFNAYIWTGLYSDWRTVATYSEMCHDVPRFGLTTDTDTSGWEGNGNEGRFGSAKATTSSAISLLTEACWHNVHKFTSTNVTINFGILCVEQ
ncbi:MULTISPECIES: lipoprotein [Leptospira]|uniref:lipoprotein n=1 Tax=Leptospira TaxID=171 RepID=UPI0002BFE6ED|nr:MULTISPECIES: lipoprotein [Leptospira]EMK10869.1 putative lipoprotein [Leptospira kirschneri]KXZ28423.1 hypothetical protein AYB32_00435 [Leptospira kirschneri]KXZ31194.1 hypothetical protein AYB34_01765 [Leptospira sp. ZV016]